MIAVRLPLEPPMPTAQALVADVAATLERFPMSGLRTCRHALPFHCRTSEWPFCSPTAQTRLAEVAATPLRLSPAGEGFGLGTCRHVLPFQCTISVRLTCPESYSPTAQALPEEVAATLNRPGYSNDDDACPAAPSRTPAAAPCDGTTPAATPARSAARPMTLTFRTARARGMAPMPARCRCSSPRSSPGFAMIVPPRRLVC